MMYIDNMRIVDEDEDLLAMRRQLAYLLLPVDVQRLHTAGTTPASYLIDFYGPQLTEVEAIDAAHRFIETVGAYDRTHENEVYKLYDLIVRYTRGMRSNAASLALQQDFEAGLQEALPRNPLFSFVFANVLATVMSWAFDRPLHFMKLTDITPQYNALQIVIENVGIPTFPWVDA